MNIIEVIQKDQNLLNTSRTFLCYFSRIWLSNQYVALVH